MTSDSHDDERPSKLRWLLGVVVLLAVPLVIIWWPGCREYPPASSPEALEVMKLVYTACNTRSEQRLTEAEKKASQLAQEGKLSAQEQALIGEWITKARAGGWDEVADAAFRYFEDQVGVGSPQ